MAFREVTMLEVKEVLTRWLDGEAKKKIARGAGLARNTMRGYIAAAEAEGLAAGQGAAALTEECLGAVMIRLRAGGPREHGESWAVCEARRGFIAEKLSEGLLLTNARASRPAAATSARKTTRRNASRAPSATRPFCAARPPSTARPSSATPRPSSRCRCPGPACGGSTLYSACAAASAASG